MLSRTALRHRGDRADATWPRRASPQSSIHFVGNVMIDTLLPLQDQGVGLTNSRGARPRPPRIRGVDSTSSEQRGQFGGAAAPARCPRLHRLRCAHCLSGSSKDVAAAETSTVDDGHRPWPQVDRSTVLSRLHQAHEQRCLRADRLRRHPGGNHGSRHPLPDPSHHHGATGDDHVRYQSSRGARPREDRAGMG